MQDLQDVFNRVQDTKRARKDIQTQYKDALDSSAEYKDIVEKIRGFKLRKKQIEDDVKSELGSQYDKLLALKKDLDLDKELMADLAISKLVAGESVALEDSEKNVYEPIFSVKFKKMNEVDQRKQE